MTDVTAEIAQMEDRRWEAQIAEEQVKLRRIELRNEKLVLQTLQTQAELLRGCQKTG